jgi:hypothetical protein
VARERARLLRQVGRLPEARHAWQELAGRNGPLSAVAWVELAKVLEHIDRDYEAALQAVTRAERLAAHSATMGRPLALLEADLVRRRVRLERRRAAAATAPESLSLSLPTAARQTRAHALANG